MDAKKIKGFLPIVASVLFFAMTFFFFVKPMQKQIRDYSARSRVLEDKIKKDIPEWRILKMKNLADSTKTVMELIEKRILGNEKLYDVGTQIGQQAKDHQMTLVAVRPDYSKLAILQDTKEEIHELPITIELKGYFKDFTRFWDAIPDFPFAMKVMGVNFLRESVEKPVLTVEMKSIFFFREIKEVKAKGELPAGTKKT